MQAWRKTLLAPQDGMWESLRSFATQWEIKVDEQLVGYASVDEQNRLLQFYLASEWQQIGLDIFAAFIEQQQIKQALIGTHNPIALSLGLHFQQSLQIDTYLFEDHLEVALAPKSGVFRAAETTELAKIVEFYHQSMDAPRDWLNDYLSGHISKGEVFFLEQEGEVLGACEVRRSATNPEVADIGMVVSPACRKQGYGSFMLGKAKAKAIEWGRRPICSCEKGNTGSLKSIQNNGFRSLHQLLLMEF